MATEMGAARCQKLGETDFFFCKRGKDLVNFNIKKGSPAWTFSYQKSAPAWTFLYLFQKRLSGVNIFIFISNKAIRRRHFHFEKALKALLCGHFHTRMKIENTY